MEVRKTHSKVVTPLDGIRRRAKALGIPEVLYANDTISAAVAVAKKSDLTILVAGSIHIQVTVV